MKLYLINAFLHYQNFKFGFKNIAINVFSTYFDLNNYNIMVLIRKK